MFVLNFNNKQVEDIAKDFLSQSYSVIQIKKSELVDQTWIIEILVSSYGKDSLKKVKVSNKTGHIMGFE